MKRCIFCHKEMKQEESKHNKLEVYACRGCKLPRFNTVYRRLNYVDQEEILHDLIMVDDYCVTRWYSSEVNPHAHSLVYKDVIGVMRGVMSLDKLSPEPISLNNPACELDGIVNINTSNLEMFKHKLSTWITFS